MSWVVDTDVLSEPLQSKPNLQVVQWLSAHQSEIYTEDFNRPGVRVFKSVRRVMRSLDLTLLTRNMGEVSRVAGLKAMHVKASICSCSKSHLLTNWRSWQLDSQALK